MNESSSPQQVHNKAVIDRRLRPRVATWEVTLRARKVIPRARWPATVVTAHGL